MTCPSCASEVPVDARFCPNCGHALIGQVDERRVVTVVFGDIVGFTGLSELRDPEQVKHLVDRCFERLADDVVSFGGHVDKVVGDAIVALFGAPVAHEDDAERAVRAALQMQRTLREVDDLGPHVRMRIGVNTGEVLFGSLRAGGDSTAMGDVVNIASRLETMAEPGQVVVGQETYEATADVIRYEPLGELETRGREAGVTAWEAVAQLSEPGTRRRFNFPLIGRDAELAMLRGAVESAMFHRRPSIVLVTGEAGVGKSRLGNELLLDAQARLGVRYFGGRTLPYGQRNPWWLLAELVRSICDLAYEDISATREKCAVAVAAALEEPYESAEVGRVVEAFLYVLGLDGRLTDVDGVRAKDEVTHAFQSLFEGMAAQQPLIIALGDLQWAGDLVLEVLDRVLERMPRVPLVFFTTARPELLARWRPPASGFNELVIHLDPLSDEASGELLIAFLGHDPGAPVRRELVRRAGGNALFLEEFAALLNETGDVVPIGFATLPATLRGLVAARLDALPADERAVLDALAVLSRKGLIAGVVSLTHAHAPQVSVRSALGRLHDKDMIEIDGDRVEFVSDLVREVAYNTLSKGERARRHAWLAAWLEDEAAKRDRGDEVLEELSHHWVAAAELSAEVGDVDGVPENVREIAMIALQRAAERADDRELHAVSGELFGQMVELLGDVTTAARRHALVGRARAATALHRNVAAAADLDVVEAESVAVGDEVALARALVVRGDLLRNIGDFDESVAVLERALALWRGIGDRRGEASALRRIGVTYLYSGRADQAEPFVLEALDAFREVGVRRGIAWAQQNLAWIALTRGQAAVAEQRIRDSISLFQEIGDWAGESWGLGMLATLLSAQGQTDEAEELAKRLIADAESHGDTWLAGMMAMVLGTIRLDQGRITHAVEQLQGARKSFNDLRDTFGMGRTLLSLAHALRLAGRIEEAEQVVDGATGTVSSQDNAGPLPLAGVLTAQHAVELGQPDIALAALDLLPHSNELDALRGEALAQGGCFDAALDVLAAAGNDPHTLVVTALALVGAGRTGEARSAAEAARIGPMARYRHLALASVADACAAAADGDRAAARAALDKARRHTQDSDDRLTPALVSLARAVLLDDPASRVPLEELGVTAMGWEALFAAAAAASATTTATPA